MLDWISKTMFKNKIMPFGNSCFIKRVQFKPFIIWLAWICRSWLPFKSISRNIKTIQLWLNILLVLPKEHSVSYDGIIIIILVECCSHKYWILEFTLEINIKIYSQKRLYPSPARERVARTHIWSRNHNKFRLCESSQFYK